MSVDTYDSDDWQKLRAAVNALKNPVLDDSVLLESTQFGLVQSHSNQNIDLTEDEIQALKNGAAPFGYQSQEYLEYDPDRRARNHARRASESGILSHQVSELFGNNNNNPYESNSGNLTDNWVAGLPESGRRARSHTEPIMPLDSLLAKRYPTSSKAGTLPGHMTLEQGQSEHVSNGVSEKKGDLTEIEIADSNTLPQSLPAHVSGSQRTSVLSSVSSPSSTSDAKPGSGLQSPMTPLTPSSKLIKIYMSRVQKR